jgi:hypothetical protein
MSATEATSRMARQMLTARRVRSLSTIWQSAASPAAQIEDRAHHDEHQGAGEHDDPHETMEVGRHERPHRGDREHPRLGVDALERDRLPQAERMGDIRAPDGSAPDYQERHIEQVSGVVQASQSMPP